MKSLIRFFVERPLFANLLTFLVIASGIIIVPNIRREAFPVVEFGIVTIQTIWPGASPGEVERLLTTPLEQAIKGVDGIKELGSVSVENRSVMIAELDPNASGAEIDAIVDDIERAIATVRDLPEDAEAPVVEAMDSRKTPIIEINLSGSDEMAVREKARDLEERLLDVKGVAAVAKRGWRERQFLVEVKPATLERFKVSIAEVARALQGRNVNLPGGKVKSSNDEWLIRAVGEFETAEDVNPVVVRANELGGFIQVQDLATVRDALEETTTINRSRGQRSIDLVVIKQARSDAIDTVAGVREAVEEFRPKIDEGMTLDYTNDFSVFVKRRLGIVVNNAWLGLGLVLVALLAFLSFREAIWTAIGIPFSLMATLLTMQAFGMTVNLISLMGFVLVVGMLVDDAICVSENIHRYRFMGLDPVEASVRGTYEVVGAITGSVLTTIAAFLPLAFMSGIFGKFVWAIPTVVIIALTFSLIEASIALPAHLRGGKKVEEPKQGRFDRFAARYARFVGVLLKMRYAVALGVVAILVFAGFVMTRLDFQLFGGQGIEIFMVRAQSAPGTPLEETEEAFAPIEKAIAELPKEELDTFTAMVGVQQQDPNDPFTKRGSHYAQANVFLTPTNARDRSADEIIEALRQKIEGVKGFERIHFARVNPGPPVGKPVSVRFLADDFEMLAKLEQMGREEMAKVEGVVDVESDLEPGKKELRLKIDERASAEAGVSPAEVALAVRAAFDGISATKVRKLDEEIDVRVLFTEAKRESGRKALEDVRVPNRMGYLIPLRSLARIEEDVGFTSIKHSDGKRVLTLGAEVDSAKTSSFRANKALQPAIVERMKSFPDARVSFTGEDEDTKESMAGLARAFVLAAALIFLIIASVFGSITQPVLVMFSIPLGFAGVVFAFYAHGQPFGFLSIMGVVGLAGVVVNNSIVLIDFVNQNRRVGGMDRQTSIVEAARVRLRPMLLTSITTLSGLMPTAYGIGGDDPFVRPMALALAWGLAFSLFMTLLTLPPMILILDDILSIPAWIVHGRSRTPIGVTGAR